MSKIRSRNTKPEILVRKFLFHKGFRYRLNIKHLPGTPDIVFSKYKVIIFINGCFWHGHGNCKIAHLPKTRTDWWQAKIETNILRDSDNIQKLKELGWNIIVIWECQLKPKNINNTLYLLDLELSKYILKSYQK